MIFPHIFFDGNKFEYEIDISQMSIFQVDRVLSGRKYRDKVKTGWAASLNELIWEKVKSDCCWSFK